MNGEDKIYSGVKPCSSSVWPMVWQTVSAVAMFSLVLAMPHDGRAQEAGSKLVLELSGGWLSGEQQVWAELCDCAAPSPVLQHIGPGNFYGGTLGLITPMNGLPPSTGGVNSSWEAAIFARFGASAKQTKSATAEWFYNIIGGNFPSEYDHVSANHREKHAIIDLEVRRNIGSGNDNAARTTAKAGVRFAYFVADTQTDFIYLPDTYFTLQERRKTEFIGVGPRVGFETVTPIANHVTFDLSGGASLLLGRKNTAN